MFREPLLVVFTGLSVSLFSCAKDLELPDSGRGGASASSGGVSGGTGASGASSTAGSSTSSGGFGAGGASDGGRLNDAGGSANAAGAAHGGRMNGGSSTTGGAGSVAGANVAGGSAGSTASGGTNQGGAVDGGAPNPSSGCSRDLLICEDFEDTAIGNVPSGWTRHGNQANVADDQSHRGERSLKLGAAASGERRIYRSATLLGKAHWGRIFYKVQTPVPDAFVHSTLVALSGRGPTNGNSEYRPIDTVKQAKNTPDVGSRHNFIFNVQIIGGSEFGRETSYDYNFDGQWHCVEYQIDAADQSFTLYFDGNDVLRFKNGAGNYNRSDIPDVFQELRVGWNNYQSASPGFTAWIDDLAFDDARIGCD